MNTIKEYVTGLAAAAVMERHLTLSPFAGNLKIHLERLGHLSAWLDVAREDGLKDAKGGIDPGALVTAMNVAVTLIADAAVPASLRWSINEFTLSRIAPERIASVFLKAESEDLDWTSPGNKVVKISVSPGVSSRNAEPFFIGDVIVVVLASKEA